MFLILITYEAHPDICAVKDVAALSGVFQKSQLLGYKKIMLAILSNKFFTYLDFK